MVNGSAMKVDKSVDWVLPNRGNVNFDFPMPHFQKQAENWPSGRPGVSRIKPSAYQENFNFKG